MRWQNADDKLIDMHAHLFAFSEEGGRLLEQLQNSGYLCTRKELMRCELNYRKAHGIFTCLSSGTPEEWREQRHFAGEEVLCSFGIHPWYADRYQPEEYREYFASCDMIGEIGMDSVWCEIPLAVQRKKLEIQLQIAVEMQKPVVLHTKGQEKEIAEMLRGFPCPILVHWYSGDREALERFLDLDCWFTLGPDFSLEQPLYRYLIKTTGANRLFLETDGLSAIRWVKNMAEEKQMQNVQQMQEELEKEKRSEESALFSELERVLAGNLEQIAEQKNLPSDAVKKQMADNLREFIEFNS